MYVYTCSFTEVVSFSLLRIIKQHNNGVLHCNINHNGIMACINQSDTVQPLGVCDRVATPLDERVQFSLIFHLASKSGGGALALSYTLTHSPASIYPHSSHPHPLTHTLTLTPPLTLPPSHPPHPHPLTPTLTPTPPSSSHSHPHPHSSHHHPHPHLNPTLTLTLTLTPPLTLPPSPGMNT